MARDHPIGVEVGFLWWCCCCVHEVFPKHGIGVAVFGVCVFLAFFKCWSVCGVSFFVPKYLSA